MYSQYTVFCCLAECGSYEAAAERLGSTRDSVSKTIHKIEKDLDLILFAEEGDAFSLTEEGALLMPFIYESALAEEKLLAKIRLLKAVTRHPITVNNGAAALQSPDQVLYRHSKN